MDLPKEVEVPYNANPYIEKYGVLLFVAICLGGGVFDNFYEYQTLMSICTIIVSVGLTIVWVRNDYFKMRTLRITEQGILEMKGNKQTFIKWSEYHQTYYDGTNLVLYGLPIGTVGKIQICADGKTIFVAFVESEVNDKIMELSAQHMLPQLRERLKKGVKLYFGPIELNSLFIFIKRKEIRRDHITKAKLHEGKLILKYDGSWFSTKVAVKDIPNITSLVILLSEGFNPTHVIGDETNVTLDV